MNKHGKAGFYLWVWLQVHQNKCDFINHEHIPKAVYFRLYPPPLSEAGGIIVIKSLKLVDTLRRIAYEYISMGRQNNCS